MATIFGLAINDIEPNADFRPVQSENGGQTATQTFTLRTQSWNNSTVRNKFRRGTNITELNPDIGTQWNYFTITSIALDFQEGDILVVTVDFSGSSTAQYPEDDPDGGISEEAIPTYRLEGRLAEKPFAEHPKWKALGEQEQIALGKLISGDYGWGPDPFGSPTDNATHIIQGDGTITIITPDPITSADGIEFAKRITKGESTYLVPSTTWTETTQGNEGMTAAQLNKLGRISTPRGGPPTPSGSRNWMLTGASQEQRGDLYQTQLEWSLSERDGYDSFLYDT
jgi:hypothetical protein